MEVGIIFADVREPSGILGTDERTDDGPSDEPGFVDMVAVGEELDSIFIDDSGESTSVDDTIVDPNGIFAEDLESMLTAEEP